MTMPGLVPGVAVAPSRPMKSVRITREAEGDAVDMKSVKVTFEGASAEEDVVSVVGLLDWVDGFSRSDDIHTISGKSTTSDDHSCCKEVEEHGAGCV